ncbi:MAG TPA: VCBS repeat-containing protein, partial [Polyangium sp.]|nr:VCBS repeat-containing protein [Polyangium sp.]
QYGKIEHGFDDVKTNIDAPLSLRASPIFSDMNGDGLSDWLVPDTTPLSTAANPITEWRLAGNRGKEFAASNVAFSQEWSVVQDPDGSSDPLQIQPELGTVIDYNDDRRKDILLHDVYGNRNTHTVLALKADGTFEEIDTQIQRPFPLGPAPKQLRGTGGSVHLADVDGNGFSDLIQCTDHGQTPETAATSTWMLHLWAPTGWDKLGTVIEKLQGYPCNLELYTLDLDRSGTTDLVIPGMIAQGGVPTERAPNYYVFRRNSDGTWESYDTNLRIPQGRVVFGYFNGDGLPDGVTGDNAGRLLMWMNTGKGFAKKPENALDWDGHASQTKYLHLAQPLDWDGNGQTDLLIPLVDSISPDIPRWVILRAAGGANEFTFERIDSGIPFEPALGDAITLADPHGPRIGDINGDGAPDVAIFLGNQLHLFVNRAKNPDVLVGFSDGLNERDPEDTAFIPNVSVTYGHLTDEWITNGEQPNDSKKESYLYLSHDEASNGCAYPRHCAVGSKRVVREYATNDGQGGQRRFGLRYRDGRYDLRGYGFLGFGQRILTDLDTGATTATFYDNVTLVDVGKREVYSLAGRVKSQWRWAPALPNENNAKRVELLFTDTTLETVTTNGGQTYFTIPTQRHTRRMQGEHSSSDSLMTWVANIEATENATMLRDTTVDVLDFDEFGNVLETDVSTIGVDLTFHIQRTVKNDTDGWILGQLQFQTECSSASGLAQGRTTTRTTNAFGEVETESTASDDGIDDTKLTVADDQRDKFGNVKHVT